MTHLNLFVQHALCSEANLGPVCVPVVWPVHGAINLNLQKGSMECSPVTEKLFRNFGSMANPSHTARRAGRLVDERLWGSYWRAPQLESNAWRRNNPGCTAKKIVACYVAEGETGGQGILRICCILLRGEHTVTAHTRTATAGIHPWVVLLVQYTRVFLSP